MKMDKFNDLQIIKRRFFAMRNGIIADTIRKSGAPYRMIFGLNLPQIDEIARETGKNKELAEKLHADTSTRESQLLAPMLMPEEEMTPEKAIGWIAGAPSHEAIDILCHRLLRRLPFALDTVEQALNSDIPHARYAAVRLMWNLIPAHADEVYPLASREASKGEDAISLLARNLMEEIDFLREM